MVHVRKRHGLFPTADEYKIGPLRGFIYRFYWAENAWRFPYRGWHLSREPFVSIRGAIRGAEKAWPFPYM